MGGAAALISAARHQLKYPKTVSAVYTYGAPKVGDAVWGKTYTEIGLEAITYK